MRLGLAGSLCTEIRVLRHCFVPRLRRFRVAFRDHRGILACVHDRVTNGRRTDKTQTKEPNHTPTNQGTDLVCFFSLHRKYAELLFCGRHRKRGVGWERGVKRQGVLLQTILEVRGPQWVSWGEGEPKFAELVPATILQIHPRLIGELDHLLRAEEGEVCEDPISLRNFFQRGHRCQDCVVWITFSQPSPHEINPDLGGFQGQGADQTKVYNIRRLAQLPTTGNTRKE